MEHNRKQKLLMIFALVAGIASLSVGFAAFSTTLNISSGASITPNSDTFSVKFSTNQNSLVVGDVIASDMTSGITTTNGIINNSSNPTITNLSATFTSPGQYVEYTFYARNEGEYTAYLNNINFIGTNTCNGSGGASESLVDAACGSIYTIVYLGESRDVYFSTSEITNRPLAKGASEKITLRIEYAYDGVLADGPFDIFLQDISFVYSTIDDSTFKPSIESNSEETLYNKIKLLSAKTDENIDFKYNQESGVFIKDETKNDINPIYYYRGIIDNNNVLFANFCWKIVRTTATGGVKMIYNGTPTDNTCLGTNPVIDSDSFNEDYQSLNSLNYILPSGEDSTIKSGIDKWYEENLVSYTDKLEDTPWCNDLKIENVVEEGKHIRYMASKRNGVNWPNEEVHPTIICDSQYELTVSATNVQNRLKYPIALLTTDELTLGGIGAKTSIDGNYLHTGNWYWTLSPENYYGAGLVIIASTAGKQASNMVLFAGGYRPAISLAPNTIVAGGDGTTNAPYKIA